MTQETKRKTAGFFLVLTSLISITLLIDFFNDGGEILYRPPQPAGTMTPEQLITMGIIVVIILIMGIILLFVRSK